jgi:hypothetical protein
MSKKIKATTAGSITASTYSMLNTKNPKTDSGSLFIRDARMVRDGVMRDTTYYVSNVAANLLGIGSGLTLEVRPVPKGQTRYFNCIWLGKMVGADDPSYRCVCVYGTKRKNTEPFYVVSRKPNKSLEKELARFVDRMDETSSLNDYQIIDAQDLLRRSLNYVRV